MPDPALPDPALPDPPHDPAARVVEPNAVLEPSAVFERIARPRSLPDEIADSITGAIDEGRLRPGDRLPTEHALSAQFGVARTVVREAVSLLKHDGIIRARRGVGAFVSPTGERNAFRIGPACFAKRRQLAQLLQLRVGTLSEAASLAALARTEAQLAAIAGHLDAMREAVAGEVVREPAALDALVERRVDAEAAFYEAITVASGNEYYVEFVGMIEGKVAQNLRSVALKNARVVEWGREVVREHEAVHAAIRDRDAEAARRATRGHFESAAQRLIDRKDFADV